MYHVTPRETNYEVRNCGMELDHEYVFRVTAYNAGGESETSDPSEPITAMERFVKPRLDKDLIGKEREMHAGTMLRSNIFCWFDQRIRIYHSCSGSTQCAWRSPPPS